MAVCKAAFLHRPKPRSAMADASGFTGPANPAFVPHASHSPRPSGLALRCVTVMRAWPLTQAASSCGNDSKKCERLSLCLIAVACFFAYGKCLENLKICWIAAASGCWRGRFEVFFGIFTYEKHRYRMQIRREVLIFFAPFFDVMRWSQLVQDVHCQHAAFAGEVSMATSVQAPRTAAARSLVELLFAFIILVDERVVTDTSFE